MKLKITVFKASGKFYADAIAESSVDIPIFDPKFAGFIKDHLPAKISDGYVVVQDAPGSDGFHTILYQMSRLLDVAK